MFRQARVAAMSLTIVFLWIGIGVPAEQAKCFRVTATNNLGVPLHAEAGDARVSGRLPDGTVVSEITRDEATGWIKVAAASKEGWITNRYVGEVVPCTTDEGGAATAATANVQYVIGCWNLEHFHEGAKRGFPENRSGGPSYPTRSDEDYSHIGKIIDQLGVKILVLSEINGQEQTIEEDEDQVTDLRSPELDKLITTISTGTYDYTIGEAGGTQHLAILYDTNVVELLSAWEMSLPNVKVQKKGLFDRQPLVGHFRFRRGENQGNDLAVVAVHLASGQQHNKNHDQAMALIQEEIQGARAQGWCLPKDENDIVIMGDFNASRFDNTQEGFWDEMERSGWDVLADDVDQYPPTRLSGVPLGLNESRIDYIVGTKGSRGLVGEEVDDVQGYVHEELLMGNAEQFRRRASDHLPVTIKIRVMDDTDTDLPITVRRSRPGPVLTMRAPHASGVTMDEDLEKLIEAWPTLSTTQRSAILTISSGQ